MNETKWVMVKLMRQIKSQIGPSSRVETWAIFELIGLIEIFYFKKRKKKCIRVALGVPHLLAGGGSTVFVIAS